MTESSEKIHPADHTFEYCCWLHPDQIDKNLTSKCPSCGLPYGFPIKQVPAEINGKAIEKALGRGFYGAVYKARHPRTNRPIAIKLVPKLIHSHREETRGGQSFEEEARLHAELSEMPIIAALTNWGDEKVVFGDHAIDCWWVEMDFVEGRLLADIVEEGPRSPRQAAQIAWDLLEFIQLMRQRGSNHNDLHAENIMVVELDDTRARRRAIDPHTEVRILDLGSAGSRSASHFDRLGDIDWVAIHIRDMINAYERNHPEMDPETLRLCAQLRRVAEFYSATDLARKPEPSDMQSYIRSVHAFGNRPWQGQVTLSWLAEHYNAQTLPSWYAPELLVDPEKEWTKRLTAAGPTLVAGMRGCGKTILLRSLEWTARLHRMPNESEEDVHDRVRNDRFLGLFVSCAALLRRPRSRPPDAPLHRLFLAFAREIIRDVQVTEAEELADIDYAALDEFASVVKGVVPWFAPPSSTLDPTAMDRALSSALQQTLTNGTRDSLSINTKESFEELAVVTRRLTSLWRDKMLLFMLDDVSTRALPLNNVEELLSQFSVSSPHFGFKVSTENQTLALTTPGGELARRYRDYDYFDLGTEVIRRCASGPRFVEDVLAARAKYTEGLEMHSPRSVLGTRSLNDLAISIRDTPANSKVYWGIDALAAMCVGDVGDILQIYSAILEVGAKTGYPVQPSDQHDAAVRLSEDRLVSLAGRDEWLFNHATAFSEASHAELARNKGGRPRQYALLNLEIDRKHLKSVFARIIELIDAGVFVLTGITTRSKGDASKPYLQIKLAYSLILGLPKRIPLGKRGRFELPSSVVGDWLETPRPEKLQRGASPILKEEWAPIEAEEDPVPVSVAHTQQELELSVPESRANDSVPPARTLREVTTIAVGKPNQIPIQWNDVLVVAGAGFEDRTLGAWQALLPTGHPKSVVTVNYTDKGYREKIEELLKTASVPYQSISAKDLQTADAVKEFVRTLDAPLLAVDVTSLTKSMIYQLVRRILLEFGEVLVLHTQAAEYFPPSNRLTEIVSLFEADDYLAAFSKLDQLVSGVTEPYETVTIGENRRDSSQPSYMVAFVPLKFKRLEKLLDDVPVEQLAAVAPESPAGPTSSRTVVGQYIARYCVDRYGGEFHEIRTLDHEAGYHLLSELHRTHALDGHFNFEIALTGSKMHAVSAAMLGAVAQPAAVYYSSPASFDPKRYTRGSGETTVAHLRLGERIQK
jgi:serine/threonine protein kinase